MIISVDSDIKIKYWSHVLRSTNTEKNLKVEGEGEGRGEVHHPHMDYKISYDLNGREILYNSLWYPNRGIHSG